MSIGPALAKSIYSLKKLIVQLIKMLQKILQQAWGILTSIVSFGSRIQKNIYNTGLGSYFIV